MRVTCHSLAEFWECLDADPAETVLQKAVRVATMRRPLQSGTPCLKWGVAAQVAAVVDLVGGGQYLLEAVLDCGIDFTDATQELKGSQAAAEVKAQVQAACHARGWKALPGIIEI